MSSRGQSLNLKDQPIEVILFKPRLKFGMFRDVMQGLESVFEECLSQEEILYLYQATGHLDDEEFITLSNKALETLDYSCGLPSIQWFVHQAEIILHRSATPKIHVVL